MATLMVLQKPMLAVYPPATLTAWYYAVGSLLALAVCAFFGVQPVDFLFTGQWEVGGWVGEARLGRRSEFRPDPRAGCWCRGGSKAGVAGVRGWGGGRS